MVLNAPAPSDFNDASKAEKRQKVEDEREAKLQRRQQDMKDGKVSEALEKDVEKQEAAESLQDGELVKGTTEGDAARKRAEERAEAQGDNLGGGLGDDLGYGEAAEPSDDEEDDFEGNPMAQQVDQTRKK